MALCLLLSWLRAASAAPAPASAPRPEAVIGSLLSATGKQGSKGHQLPRALLAQLYANAIKLSDLSGGVNGTVLSGEPVFSPVRAGRSRSAVSLAAAAGPAAPEEDAAPSGTDKVWLCKRPVYPVALLQQYGIPLDVAEEVNARGYHAYVLHGKSPHTSLAYQFTSTNGWELWNKVLGMLKEQGAEAMNQAALNKGNVAEWGKTMAAEISGPAETSSAPGLKIFTTATQCWGSELPSRCSKQQMDEATKAYAAKRPEFNLLSNNCARFACAMLAACGGAEPYDEHSASLALLQNSSEPAKAVCHPDTCADTLMFEGPKAQPGCGMRQVSTSLAAVGELLAEPTTPAGGKQAEQGVAQGEEQLGAAHGVQGTWQQPGMGLPAWQRALYPAPMGRMPMGYM